jgi:hypothetical protein
MKSHLHFAAIALHFSLMSCGLVCAQSEATSLAESAYKHSDTQLNEVYKKLLIRSRPMLSKLSWNLSAHGSHSEIWMQNAEPG